MTKLNLPDLTLVMVNTDCHDLSRLAIKECTDRADFGDILILSDKDPDIAHSQFYCIDPVKNAEEAVKAYWYTLPILLTTSHFLVIHWDSWIVHPDNWDKKFLDYDYIGAPWWYNENDRNVGNGGFSIRSSRLARYLLDNDNAFPYAHPEDDALCRQYRPRLEAEGFMWAPTNLASRFAFERVLYCAPKHIFGFHGMFNWPFVLSEEQIEERVALAPPHVLDHVHYRQMREAQKKIKGLVA